MPTDMQSLADTLLRNLAVTATTKVRSDCFGLMQKLTRSIPKQCLPEVHYVADGLRFVVQHEDGKVYECVIKEVR